MATIPPLEKIEKIQRESSMVIDSSEAPTDIYNKFFINFHEQNIEELSKILSQHPLVLESFEAKSKRIGIIEYAIRHFSLENILPIVKLIVEANPSLLLKAKFNPLYAAFSLPIKNQVEKLEIQLDLLRYLIRMNSKILLMRLSNGQLLKDHIANPKMTQHKSQKEFAEMIIKQTNEMRGLDEQIAELKTLMMNLNAGTCGCDQCTKMPAQSALQSAPQSAAQSTQRCRINCAFVAERLDKALERRYIKREIMGIDMSIDSSPAKTGIGPLIQRLYADGSFEISSSSEESLHRITRAIDTSLHYVPISIPHSIPNSSDPQQMKENREKTKLAIEIDCTARFQEPPRCRGKIVNNPSEVLAAIRKLPRRQQSSGGGTTQGYIFCFPHQGSGLRHGHVLNFFVDSKEKGDTVYICDAQRDQSSPYYISVDNFNSSMGWAFFAVVPTAAKLHLDLTITPSTPLPTATPSMATAVHAAKLPPKPKNIFEAVLKDCATLKSFLDDPLHESELDGFSDAGFTVLFYMIYSDFSFHNKSQDVLKKKIEFVLEKRPELINRKNKDEAAETPLMIAVNNGYLSIVKFFCERDKMLAITPNKYGDFAIRYAISECRTDILEYLINHNHNVLMHRNAKFHDVYDLVRDYTPPALQESYIDLLNKAIEHYEITIPELIVDDKLIKAKREELSATKKIKEGLDQELNELETAHEARCSDLEEAISAKKKQNMLLRAQIANLKRMKQHAAERAAFEAREREAEAALSMNQSSALTPALQSTLLFSNPPLYGSVPQNLNTNPYPYLHRPIAADYSSSVVYRGTGSVPAGLYTVTSSQAHTPLSSGFSFGDLQQQEGDGSTYAQTSPELFKDSSP